MAKAKETVEPTNVITVEENKNDSQSLYTGTGESEELQELKTLFLEKEKELLELTISLKEKDETIKELEEKIYSKDKFSDTLNEAIKELQQKLDNKEPVPEANSTVIYNHKYPLQSWVCYPSKYLNMRFQVREHINKNSKQLYRLYQYNTEVQLTDVSEEELEPTKNSFAHE